MIYLFRWADFVYVEKDSIVSTMYLKYSHYNTVDKTERITLVTVSYIHIS